MGKNKDKKAATEEPLDGGAHLPATPPRVVDEVSISDATSSTIRKRSRENVPPSGRSSSATLSSASKMVTKPGTMGPPETPARSLIKNRRPTASASKIDDPEVSAVAQVIDQHKDDSEQLATENNTSEPQNVGQDHEAVDTAGDHTHEYDDPDPDTPIEEFDWDHLTQRHVERMQDFEVKEQRVYEDLHRLNTMFQTWAGAGQAKEAERASKRLKTRISFVQQREAELSEKRQHYLHVVNAFQSALNLLERN